MAVPCVLVTQVVGVQKAVEDESKDVGWVSMRVEIPCDVVLDSWLCSKDW